jgi:hypothetical protein
MSFWLNLIVLACAGLNIALVVYNVAQLLRWHRLNEALLQLAIMSAVHHKAMEMEGFFPGKRLVVVNAEVAVRET